MRTPHPAGRRSRRSSFRAAIERLDARTLMCAVPDGPQLFGTLVPWSTSAVTASNIAFNESASPSTPVVGTAIASPRAIAAAPPPIRINAGGPAYTDPSGVAWSADKHFAGGSTAIHNVPIAGTTADPMYQDRRYGAFNYNIPVPAGAYTLKLHFSETLHTAANKRKFSVKAEGVTILNNFDIAASAGLKTAVVRGFDLTVNDGTLNLNFIKNLDNPIVSGIEVIAKPAAGNAGAVSGLTLINAATDQPIGAMTNGSVLDLTGGKTYSVRANVTGAVGAVRFLLNGTAIRVENHAPLSIAGDDGGDYAAWNVPVGSHTLTVVPYAGTNATGAAGTAYSVNFTVTRTTTPPPPPPTPGNSFTTVNWAIKAPAPLIKAEALTAQWGTRLYTFGGFSGNLGPVQDSHYYDTATNTWHSVRNLPERITHAGVAQDNQNVYIVGAYVGLPGKTGWGQTFGTNRAWVYNFASDTYTALPNLPQALAGGGAALVGRQLHYFGGQNGSRGDINIHIVLNLDNKSAGWKSAAPIPHGRSHLGAVVFGGKIYTLAGQTGNDGTLVTQRWVEVFDPATGQWTSRTQIPQAISHIQSATFVMGDRIIIAGGESAHNQPIRNVWAYTPATDKWTALTALPAARFSGVAAAFGGKIFFTGGGNQTTTWVGTPG